MARKNSRGMSAHQSAAMKSEVWLTPPEIIRALGPFDLDPCSLMPRPWPTAAAHYYPPIDGLSAPWQGRVWLNPPYGSKMAAWLRRLGAHGMGTALIFARTETDVFCRYVWEKASAALFLRGRLYFHRPDGTRAKFNAGAPSVLVAYGGYDAERLHASGLPGQFVPIAPSACLFVFCRSAANAAGGKNDGDVESWRDLLAAVLGHAVHSAEGGISLQDIYALVENAAIARGNRHWREKVRQTLNRGGFERVRRGHYRCAA